MAKLIFFAVFFFIVTLNIFEQANAAQCVPMNNVPKLLACRPAAVKNGKDPKALKGCCDTVKPYGGSKQAADCLCQSLMAARKLDPSVDLRTAISIPAKCNLKVLPNLSCNGMPIPQH